MEAHTFQSQSVSSPQLICEDLLPKVKTVVRFRPNSFESSADSRISIQENNQTIQLIREGSQNLPKLFSFSHVFNQQTTQSQLFNGSVKDIVDQFFQQRRNATIICIGECCSGKNYTLFGDLRGDQNAQSTGIIYQTAQYLLAQSQNNNENNTQNQHSNNLSVKYIELFDEKTYDLLADKGKQELPSKSTTWVGVNAVQELFQLIQKGDQRRQGDRRRMNSISCRQHSVLSFKTSNNQNTIDFVHTAGPEKVHRAGNVDKAILAQLAGVNKSLTALNQVIQALATSATYIPYRQSLLTSTLSQALGGNSLTLVIVNIDPSDRYLADTERLLKVAEQAGSIVNHLQPRE